MKNKILSLGALLIAVMFAFAFKAQPVQKFGTLFQLSSPTADPFDPASYVTPTLSVDDCDVEGKVCIIDVPTADILTSGPNAGKPNVVQTASSGELADDIVTALGASGNPTPLNGRIIYEQQ